MTSPSIKLKDSEKYTKQILNIKQKLSVRDLNADKYIDQWDVHEINLGNTVSAAFTGPALLLGDENKIFDGKNMAQEVIYITVYPGNVYRIPDEKDWDNHSEIIKPIREGEIILNSNL
ncbi:hypothetical protein HYW46_03050 [Candidatus Daviesbacteria bacterium]|nr:hypothetical protein [Candidatus Daviesbacteria bacterium]